MPRETSGGKGPLSCREIGSRVLCHTGYLGRYWNRLPREVVERWDTALSHKGCVVRCGAGRRTRRTLRKVRSRCKRFHDLPNEHQRNAKQQQPQRGHYACALPPLSRAQLNPLHLPHMRTLASLAQPSKPQAESTARAQRMPSAALVDQPAAPVALPPREGGTGPPPSHHATRGRRRRQRRRWRPPCCGSLLFAGGGCAPRGRRRALNSGPFPFSPLPAAPGGGTGGAVGACRRLGTARSHGCRAGRRSRWVVRPARGPPVGRRGADASLS